VKQLIIIIFESKELTDYYGKQLWRMYWRKRGRRTIFEGKDLVV
jgi:hypothetical protein